MSDIVADAKAWLETRPARRFRDGRTHHPTCHETHVDCLVERLVAEIEKHRMTPMERHSADFCSAFCCHFDASKVLFFYLARTAPEVKL